MAVVQSILLSTKKTLGLGESYDAFDHDIITHINSAFLTLQQLGLGPAEGFMIHGDEEIWNDFTGGVVNLNAVQSYVYLYVRLLFDPPGTPHHLTALKEQKTELEYRLKMEREVDAWVTPLSSSPSLP